MSQCLRSDVPGSLRSAAMVFALAPFWDPYSQILHSVTTGEPAFDRAFGTTIYEYLREHPDDAATFTGAAAAFHAQAIEAIAAAHDFGRYGVVVDVGGGTGSLLATILRANPGVRGVLFELDAVLAGARDQLAGCGIEDRVELVAGDFFAMVPSGDALLIKSCLHNFSDDDAVRLLKVLHAATPANGRLLVAETVVPDGNEPHYAKFDDIEMLVIAGGVDRSEQEWRALLQAGGFRTVAVTPCDDRFSLLEAVPS
jgi:SAM-dependent methyltransferase